MLLLSFYLTLSLTLTIVVPDGLGYPRLSKTPRCRQSKQDLL